jgi:hypothetical protein
MDLGTLLGRGEGSVVMIRATGNRIEGHGLPYADSCEQFSEMPASQVRAGPTTTYKGFTIK